MVYVKVVIGRVLVDNETRSLYGKREACCVSLPRARRLNRDAKLITTCSIIRGSEGQVSGRWFTILLWIGLQFIHSLLLCIYSWLTAVSGRQLQPTAESNCRTVLAIAQSALSNALAMKQQLDWQSTVRVASWRAFPPYGQIRRRKCKKSLVVSNVFRFQLLPCVKVSPSQLTSTPVK